MVDGVNALHSRFDHSILYDFALEIYSLIITDPVSEKLGLVFFLCSFLNICGSSTAKLMTPRQETFFSTHLTVQSMGPIHP